jgi:UDP-N-acetylmuramate dehydrogenase
MKYQRNESLKKHTSFRIGGLAEYFCLPKSKEELQQALLFAKEKGLRVAIFGAGTNLLVLDEGFKGLVIQLGNGLNWIEVDKRKVRVGAGVSLPRLIRSISRKGLGGLEFLAGIPGSVGGAVVMNSGAWGKEIGDLVGEVHVLDRSGKEKVIRNKQLGFAYRGSRLQQGKWIVFEVVFKLRRKKKKILLRKIKEYLSSRKAKQPVGSPNCGSVFKNPKGDFAGRLIEEAGCKGMRIGDAQVSSKHANFIVNLGEAKAKDVIKLMTRVQKAVKDKFKILLEPEIKIMVKSAA